MSKKRMTQDEWGAEMRKRFGEDPMQWKFICPVCARVQSIQEFKDSGAPETAVGFSCIGRWLEGKQYQEKGDDNTNGCNYAGGGLFRLNPLVVVSPDGEQEVFDFAPEVPDATPE